jgi:hypothetical protein
MRSCLDCGASLSPTITWCGQCYRPLVPYRSVVAVPEARRAVRHPGPTAFGLIGRLLVTALVLATGFVLRLAAGAWTVSVGRAGGALGFVALGLFAVLAVVALWGTWRPARVSRTVYVGGPLVAVTPTRRRADDPRAVGG